MEVEFMVFRRLSTTVVGVAAALLFFAGSSTAGPGSAGTDCEVGFARPVGGALEFHKFFLDVAGNGGADEFNKQFGRTTDGILVGDWDGNVSDNFAKTRQVGSTLKFLLDFGDGGQEEVGFSFGQFATDTPVGGGDWDGPGMGGTTQHIGFVRDNGSGNWRWFLDTNNDGSVAEIKNVVFGLTTDMPIVGDWDGDGTHDRGVIRNVGGTLRWLLDVPNDPGGTLGGAAERQQDFGTISDIPVTCDWDGDGNDDIGFARDVAGSPPRYRYFQDINFDGVADQFIKFGDPTQNVVPIAGDWDGMLTNP